MFFNHFQCIVIIMRRFLINNYYANGYFDLTRKFPIKNIDQRNNTVNIQIANVNRIVQIYKDIFILNVKCMY